MMSSDDELLKLLMDTFKVELDEHVQSMTQALLTLEKEGPANNHTELLEQIFRDAHSLKGAARAVELEDISELAHKLESLFSAATDGKITLAGDIFDLIYESVDLFKPLMDNATNGSNDKIDLEHLFDRLESAIAEDLPSEPKLATPPITKPGDVESKEHSATEMQNGFSVQNEQPQPLETPPEFVEQSNLQADKSQDTSDIEPEEDTQPEPEEEKKQESRELPTSDEDTIRVNTGKLDTLMNESGELLVAKMISDDRLTSVKTILNKINVWHKEWQSIALVPKEPSKTEEYENLIFARSGTGGQNGFSVQKDVQQMLDFVEKGQEQLKTVSSLVENLLKEMNKDNNRITRLTDKMQDIVMQVRMLPVSAVFKTFERMVRDISKEQGKKVNLQISGEGTEVDKKVLEEIKSPIIHLLRNSIDHGIEPPEERKKFGKPECGTIKLSAAQRGSNIVIEIADDGGGIDFEKVRKTAISKGLVSKQEANILTEQDAISLLYQHGFSIAPIVTDISGRGVGLDAVKTSVEKLHGGIGIQSTQGIGCCFTITLPLTLTTSKNLLIKEAGQTFAIPTSAIERIKWIKRDEVRTIGMEESILIDGMPIAVAKLSSVLNLENTETQSDAESQLSGNPLADEQKQAAIVFEVSEKRVALLVDGIDKESDMVTKSLGNQLPRVKNVSGASILGTGDVVIILNPADLMKSVLQSKTQVRVFSVAETEDKQPQTILVVDDSFTTRVLEQNILESVGYNVLVAEDGQKAWDILEKENVDLVVSDIQMPAIDGFELTRRVRESEQYKEMPVVLVTSLDSREDEARGLELGADAYITKGTFDQKDLLATVALLI